MFAKEPKIFVSTIFNFAKRDYLYQAKIRGPSISAELVSNASLAINERFPLSAFIRYW